MAITVNWATKVVFIPENEPSVSSVVGASHYEYDLDLLRLELKAIEGSEEGMPFVDIHQHTTSFTIGNIELARVVAIINGYTIEFENGNYQVDLVGANADIHLNRVVNDVSLNTGNTAGLITTATTISLVSAAVWDTLISDHVIAGTMGREVGGLDYAGQIWVDTAGGGSAGSVVNVNGTRINPVDNFTDMAALMAATGYNDINLKGSITFTASCTNANWINTGASATVILNGQDVTGSYFNRVGVWGDAASSTGILLDGCNLVNLTNWQGSAVRCVLVGTLSVVAGGTGIVTLAECITNGPAVLDVQGAALASVVVAAQGGTLELRGISDSGIAVLAGLRNAALSAGATNTDGTLVVTGQGVYSDTGVAGTTVVADAILNNTNVAEAVHAKNRYTKRDQTVYDANGFLTSARERWFPTKADANAGTNVTDTFTIAATPDGTEIRSPATFDKIRDV